MKKRNKTMTALLLAGVMVMGMGTSVFAEDPTPTTDPEIPVKNGVQNMTGASTLKDSYLLKNFVMDQNVTCPAVDFTFKFTPIGVNEDEYNAMNPVPNTDMPTTLGNGKDTFTVSYTTDDTAAATTGAHETAADDVVGTFTDDLIDDTRTKGISIAYILGMTKIDGTDPDIHGQKAEGVFTHAGEYVYNVTENVTTYNPETNEIIITSGATYRFRIFVKNVTVGTDHPHGVAIEGVTITRTMNQDGTTVPKPTVKVDPDPNGTTHPSDGQGKFDTDTSFAFENTFIKKSSLNVKKLVDNDYGDKQKGFPFSLTITLPASTPDSILSNQNFGNGSGVVTAEIWSGTGADAAKVTGSTDVTFTFAPTGGTPAAITSNDRFLLKDGEYLHFNTSLPVGTTYKVDELLNTANNTAQGGVTGAADKDQYANYTPSYNVVSANASGSNTAVTKTGTKGADFAVEVIASGANSGTIVGEFNTADAGKGTTDNISANLTTITNNYQNVTITGILMNNLPFILLIVVACAGIAGYVVLKRRFAR